MPKRGKSSPRRVSRGATDFLHRGWTLAERIAELEQYMSLAAIARATGIPLAWLRRFRAGAAVRTDTDELYAGILDSGFEILRKEAVRDEAEEIHRPVGKPVRVLEVDTDDPQKRRRIAGDSVDHYVAASSEDDIIAVAMRAADRARSQGFIGRARMLVLAHETTPDYPDEYFWDVPVALVEMDDAEIVEWVQETTQRGVPIILRIQDRVVRYDDVE